MTPVSTALLLALAAQLSPPPPEPAPQTPPPPPPPVVQAPVYQAPAAQPPAQPVPPAAPPAQPAPAPAAQPPAPPPAPVVAAPAAPPFRVLVAPCAAPGDNTGAAPHLRDAVAVQLMGTGVVVLVPDPVGNPNYLMVATRTDAPSLAQGAQMARADKVVCAALQPGAQPLLSVQWVDASTAQVGWSRVVPTDGTEPGTMTALQGVGAELANHVRLLHQSLPPPGPTPPAAPMAPGPGATAAAQTPASTPFFNAWRAAGVALMAVGGALLPASLVALSLSGVAHIGGNQLVLIPPGQKAPRFFSPVFTLTWGDVLVSSGMIVAGLGLVAGGAVLFVVPWILDRL